MADSPVIENSILNLIEYRLRGRPTVKTFEELHLGNSSLREIAVQIDSVYEIFFLIFNLEFSFLALCIEDKAKCSDSNPTVFQLCCSCGNC
jgi:hypothetical protein